MASIPGLSMLNWKRKACKDGDYKGLTLKGFVSKVCQDADFSGILALLLLCNDDVPHSVSSYINALSDYLGDVQGLGNIKHILLNTALFRQSDFVGNFPVCETKAAFNSALVSSSPGCILFGKLTVPYSVIDLGDFLEEKLLKGTVYYCPQEVRKKAARRECVHIRAEYMEPYLRLVKKRYDELVNPPAISYPIQSTPQPLVTPPSATPLVTPSDVTPLVTPAVTPLVTPPAVTPLVTTPAVTALVTTPAVTALATPPAVTPLVMPPAIIQDIQATPGRKTKRHRSKHCIYQDQCWQFRTIDVNLFT